MEDPREVLEEVTEEEGDGHANDPVPTPEEQQRLVDEQTEPPKDPDK